MQHVLVALAGGLDHQLLTQGQGDGLGAVGDPEQGKDTAFR
jgi:hypothetical protein